jgi:hypothetical protein
MKPRVLIELEVTFSLLLEELSDYLMQALISISMFFCLTASSTTPLGTPASAMHLELIMDSIWHKLQINDRVHEQRI